MKIHCNLLRMPRYTVAILIWILTVTLNTSRAEDTWTEMTEMPTARRALAACAVNGKIYAIGGVGGLKKTEEYDPATNTWSTKADMPKGRAYFGASVVDGKIYAIGGKTSLHSSVGYTSVDAYDPATDTWTAKAEMPKGMAEHTTCVVDGIIYVIGGWPSAGPSSAIASYDPAADTWSERPKMPTARSFASASAADGKLYVFGGINTGWPALSAVEVYDPLTDTWTRKGKMSAQLATSGVDFMGGKVYLFGGVNRRGGASQRTLYSYDPAVDSWTKESNMPMVRSASSVVALGGSFYVIGGTSAGYPYEPSLSSVWKFTPEPVSDDPDGDGIPTDVELAHGLDPNVPDADSDHDGDGLIARVEIEGGTKADDPDTDDDGLNDGVETNSGIFVSASDTGTDPTKADTDGDGLADGAEVAGGSDPFDPDSFPGAWPEVIPIDALGIEAEGIELGKNHDFFVGSFSYTSFFAGAFGLENPGLSEMAGAIYKGNLRTGKGAVLVQPTGKPVSGLSYDARTDYLYAATGHSGGYLSGSYSEQGVAVYDASTGGLISEIIFGDDIAINDLIVTENAVFCTDSYNAALFKIVLEEGGTIPSPPVIETIAMPGFEMVKVTDPDGNIIDVDLNANGIVASADGSRLIVVNVATGVLYLVDPADGSTVPMTIQGAETLFPNGDGLHLDGNTLYICRNFPNKIAVVQLSEDLKGGTFVRNLESPDLVIPTTIIGDGDSIYAINTNINDLMFGDRTKVQTEVVQLSKSGNDWPDLIPLNVAGIEAEGITLGNGHDFFVGAFSYSSFFLGAPEHSLQSGAIYKGNLRTGEGQLLVEPTGTPIAGLSHDSRTDYLYAAKGTPQGGVLVYNGATGALVADITFDMGGDSKVINDVLVTETGVYCTDSTSSVLYKVLLGEGGSLPTEPVVEQLEMSGFVMDSDPANFNANGIVSSADDNNLIVINITTGVLYLVDAETGATAPISVSGRKQRFVDGDGLYLDGHTLYICQNFSNKIAVVQLSEDFTEGTFVRNLESLDLHIPTTIMGYGDSIYAINTHFGEIAAGNHAQVLTDVVKLSTAPAPWTAVTEVVFEGSEWIRIGFDSEASTGSSDFVLQTAETLAGPWSATEAQLFETPDGTYFQAPRNLESKQAFYRIWTLAK